MPLMCRGRLLDSRGALIAKLAFLMFFSLDVAQVLTQGTLHFRPCLICTVPTPSSCLLQTTPFTAILFFLLEKNYFWEVSSDIRGNFTIIL